jgi:dihydroorotate dehydrogenase (NAD+) catalytic subunit
VTTVAGLELANPVMVAAGCGGTGRELTPYVDPARIGAFVTRSITTTRRPGNASPRIVETPSGLINAVGLQNPGIDSFLADELPWLVDHGVTVVVSIAGRSLGEYAELARRVGRAPGVAAVEVNVSAPAAEGTGVFDVREPFHAGGAVAAVRRELPRDVPVLAKLRSDLVRVVEAARTVLDAGAAAVVVGNALPAGMPDGRPGGLSGPAVRPLALRCVAEVRADVPDAEVVGCGGVCDADDARSFLAAGACAVQVGTALLHDPTTVARMIDDLSGDPG